MKKRDAYFVAWAFAPLPIPANDSGAKTNPTWLKETAKGYETKLDTVRDLLARYATNVDPSRTSQPNAEWLHVASDRIASCDA